MEYIDGDLVQFTNGDVGEVDSSVYEEWKKISPDFPMKSEDFVWVRFKTPYDGRFYNGYTKNTLQQRTEYLGNSLIKVDIEDWI